MEDCLLWCVYQHTHTYARTHKDFKSLASLEQSEFVQHMAIMRVCHLNVWL